MALPPIGSRPTHRTCFRFSIFTFVTTCALLLVGLRHFTPVAHASGGNAYFSVQTATPANSFYDYTMLDPNLTNPNIVLIVTPNWTPSGVYDNHPIGVFYSGTHWYIFHQDLTAIPNGATFNVFGQNPFDDGSSGAFVQTATSANSHYNYTVINASSLNNQPNMRVLVTPNWDPPGSSGVYNNHPIGVFYDTFSGHWCIFNQDLATIPTGASFNVNFSAPTSSYTALQIATSANSSSDYTVIDNPTANNNSSAFLLVTPDWNPGGVGGVYENHNIGVFYNTSDRRWCIFNQDRTALPNGAAFNLYIFA